MNLKNLLSKEPVAIGSAIVAVLNALVLLGVMSLNVEQITGVNIALVAVLGLLTRTAVTPNSRVLLDQTTADSIVDAISGVFDEPEAEAEDDPEL